MYMWLVTHHTPEPGQLQNFERDGYMLHVPPGISFS